MILTSYFYTVLNKRYAYQGSVFLCSCCFHVTVKYLWLSENDFLDKMLSIDNNRTSMVLVDVNVGAKNHNVNIPLILDKYNIMSVRQNLKLMQGFASAIINTCKTCRNIFL